MTTKRTMHALIAASALAGTALAGAAMAQSVSMFGSGAAAGYWQGYNVVSKIPGRRFPTSFVLNQSGTTVTGGFVTASGVYGTGTGTVSGSTATIVWTNTSPQCPGTYRNSYRITGGTMTWTYSGQDCLGTESGSGRAIRVPPAAAKRR